MSSGARVTTHYIPEATPGVTPVSPAAGAWKTMRLTGNTLSPTTNTEQSDEIVSDRMTQGSIITGMTIGGDLTGELSYGTFDDWLEAAFYGTWASNVLTIGSTRRTFSVQRAHTDVGTYHLFKGVHAATAALEIPEEGKVTLTIGAQALGYDDAETSFVTGAAAATTTPFMSSLSVGDIKVDGASLAGQACVSALTVNLDNTVQIQRCLGNTNPGPGAILATEAAVTGTLVLAWSKKAWEIWKGMLTRQRFGLEFPITDSLGNRYTIAIPSFEVDGELPNGGKRDIIQVTLNWSAAKTPPTITRAPAAAPASLTIAPATASTTVGNTVQLTATVAPAGAPQAVNWSTSAAGIATVSSTGLVTGVSAGTATITARSAVDSTKTVTRQVTVT